MSKTGIAFQRVHTGYREPTVINDGAWTSAIKDLRSSVIPLLPNFETGALTDFFLLQFSDTGTYVTSVHRISGRGTDYMSVWMFIPDTLEADGATLAGVMKRAEGMSQLMQLPPMAELEKEFGRSYPDLKVPVITEASAPEGSYAVIDITRYTLAEILGEKRYQPEYKNYKGILLLQNPATEAPGLKEIKQLQDYVTVAAPGSEETANVLGAPDIRLFIDNRPMARYVLARRNQPLGIMAKRTGFVAEKFTVIAGEPFFANVTQRPDWEKNIDLSMIKVYGREGKLLNPAHYSVMVNGQRLYANEVTPFGQSTLTNAMIKVEAPDYEPREVTGNLLRGDVSVELIPQTVSVSGKVRLPDGSMARMTIEGDSVRRGRSPLSGYSYEDGRFIPRVTSEGPAAKAIWAAIGAVGMLVLMLLIFMVVDVKVSHEPEFPWISVGHADNALTPSISEFEVTQPEDKFSDDDDDDNDDKEKLKKEKEEALRKDKEDFRRNLDEKEYRYEQRDLDLYFDSYDRYHDDEDFKKEFNKVKSADNETQINDALTKLRVKIQEYNARNAKTVEKDAAKENKAPESTTKKPTNSPGK